MAHSLDLASEPLNNEIFEYWAFGIWSLCEMKGMRMTAISLDEKLNEQSFQMNHRYNYVLFGLSGFPLRRKSDRLNASNGYLTIRFY